jgi:hypothetical protein
MLCYVKLHFVATPLVEGGGGVNALPNEVNLLLRLHQHCNHRWHHNQLAINQKEERGDKESVSALSAEEYTTTLLVMVT